MAVPDMELKQAFSELQSKVVDSKQKIKLHDLQIENMKRSITHATLTDTEIGQLPQGTKVYESAGRMFLLSDIKAVRSGLDNKSEGYKEKIHILNGNKEYLEKQIKEQENNLRELITVKKNAT
eukprot:TRINITY_DN1477_c0_g1_i1.p1 TRINITY_DN1477_c0_g1~~TRINITY_DN1477_c0_g1_i1.p1  ORF type:complete len:123 (-),score=52.54 TRINITY_DN1477_c0_g1_i1:215-583(-)